MLQRVSIVFLILCCIPAALFAQSRTMKQSYQKEWSKADSLMDKGLPESAVKVVDQILKDAGSRNDHPNVIKAQLFLMNAGLNRDENAEMDNIKKAEACLAAASGPEKAVWQSITASLYWRYFQRNRWRLYQRTALAETKSDDIATWDAPAFFSKVSGLYQESIADRTALQGIPVEKYAPLLVEGVNTRKLRPTLYDLLVFRAIAFFENDEKDVINPADQFQIEGPLWFDDAARFSEVKVKVKNASSLHFQALKLYQEAIAFHLKDAAPDALIDADLQRLRFVYSNAAGPDKDSLYLAALQRLRQRYDGQPAVAQVAYLIAVQQMGQQPARPFKGRTQPAPVKNRKPDRDLRRIKADLEQIVAKYPGTEGAVNAWNLIRSLDASSLTVNIEDVNLPSEPVKALVQYKNRNKVYLSLFRVPNNIKIQNYEQEEVLLKQIAGLSPVKKWEQALPGSDDMEDHSTEVKIEALPAGAYLLVASSGAGLGADIVTATSFQVSTLSFVRKADKGYVLHRKTGYPVAGTVVRFWSQRYNNKANRYESRAQGSATAAADGSVTLPVGNGDYENTIQAFTLVKEKDSLQLGGYLDGRKPDDYNRSPDAKRSFFFTDRSIYRPGQTIYFKGIVLNVSAGGRKTDVAGKVSRKVTLYDANGQAVQSLDLVSNEFGSVAGKFTAPEGGLAGEMRLGDGDGSVSFSVEEYKRPKFYVDFDTLKGNYALNQQVQVKGYARAYAGNNIDGATVKYRVMREARFPYYWCFYLWGRPSSPEMEIANGTATTNADGAFELSFTTIPDKMVDPQSLPVFTYKVYADVTDVNGETRSGNTGVSAGYRSLQLSAVLGEESRPSDLKKIKVRTENLNGIFVPATVKLSVAQLKFSGFFRKRLWALPDQFVMTETEFRAAFPQDEYKEESNYLNWEKGKVLHEQTFTSTGQGDVTLPEETWYQNGWYVIELSTKDAQGNEIVEKKYTHVWAPGKKEPVQQALITYTAKDSYQPGDELELWHGTAVDNPYLLVIGARAGATLSVDAAKNPWKLKLTEADRGGLALAWIYVYNNRVYTAEETIGIPWSNKELQLEWATHRDKLLPGAAEEWSLTVKGPGKEKVAAEMVAGLYDASLDAFRPHGWERGGIFPYAYLADSWESQYGFGIEGSRQLRYLSDDTYRSYEKRYDEIFGDAIRTAGYGSVYAYQSRALSRNLTLEDAAAPAAPVAEMVAGAADERKAKEAPRREKEESASADSIAPKAPKGPADAPVPVRKNLQETAFFFPQLATDAEGNVKIKFTLPEALAEWKLMALAHTKEWQTGYLEGKVKTQKDLMVMPNLPRFLRQNDDIVISTKISNLSGDMLNGEARLEILDAATLQPLDLPFRLKESKQAFSAAKGQSTTANWTVHIPESRYTPVVLRITAKAGNFTDGEENTLPVITNRTLVTETLPLPVRGNQEKTFTLDKLLHQNSNTLANHALTVEFTGNPAWYAVQALPYLMEYPYECAEQTFNRYYANALAGHIVSQSPKVAQIFDSWKTTDTAALLSNLQKNEELKSALLEETPWVMEAKDENEQKHRIAMLFQTHQLAKELKRNLAKLKQMQQGEGGFPWFKGMQSDRYITQYIVTGLARLKHLGVGTASGDDAATITATALPYLDRKLKEDYDALVKSKAKLTEQQIGYTQVQYLYMRSFYSSTKIPAASQKAFDYYRKQAAQYWSRFNPYLKGQIALALSRFGEPQAAGQVMASLKETATNKEEMGMYWSAMPAGYWWYEAPVEGQSLLIEAFAEVSKDDVAVDAMKVWLLKQKQTQNWKTTKATADACYALLLKGSDWLTAEPVVTIKLGQETIRSTEIKTEAGTGYFKKRYPGLDVKNDMGTIKVKVDNQQGSNTGVSWGAVYWQYFEDLDKITGAATPLSIKKQLFVERNTDRGPVLTEIKEGNELQVGDKVKVRIELRADRDMEYVHMKDMRAACMEPVNVLSGYKYQGGLGYYESTRDVSTNFFFDYLRKGTYVFEYPVFVSAKGDFSNGITTIQCMYAPEFSSHSEGIRVKVK
ncbi:alpha-2-macroglobulin family protein [Taibaiella koreensis]|uniref:alpha-2-macroglobulin family protein n=1 Tax=Taibaiella koreensis TaxID=1268548 RepID=UPI000E59BCB0|nr:alpha-2-macroglobulin family protein [Taibaiella koreensis]